MSFVPKQIHLTTCYNNQNGKEFLVKSHHGNSRDSFDDVFISLWLRFRAQPWAASIKMRAAITGSASYNDWNGYSCSMPDFFAIDIQ